MLSGLAFWISMSNELSIKGIANHAGHLRSVFLLDADTSP